jgi:hypothetical protein
MDGIAEIVRENLNLNKGKESAAFQNRLIRQRFVKAEAAKVRFFAQFL